MVVTPCPPFAADDLLAIMKGIVDAAGERRECDDATLLARLESLAGEWFEESAWTQEEHKATPSGKCLWRRPSPRLSTVEPD
jgi:hypothetical protein